MTLQSRLVKACGQGNKCACNIVKGIRAKVQALYASTEFDFGDASNVIDHPNKMPFKGVLLRVNEPSDKPPHGSEFHRIYVSSSVVDEKLPTLIGMAVNYDPSDMDEHKTKHKVGIITKAGRKGKDVWVKGFVWKKDFPEAERDLKKPNLGMSMELSNVEVENEHASVWKLDDFSFTGATILDKDAAAYHNTTLSAAAKAAAAEEGEQMKKPKEEKKVAAANKDTGQRNNTGDMALLASAIGGQLSTALANTFGPLVAEIKASNQKVLDRLDVVEGERVLAAAADVDDEEDDEVVMTAGAEASDDDDMEAASDEDASDDAAMTAKANEDDESSDDDDSSEEDGSDELEAELENMGHEDASEETGHVNSKRGNKNKGSKTTVTDPPTQGEHFSGNVAKGRLAAAKGNGMKKPFPGLKAAAEQISTLTLANKKLKRAIQAQADKHASTSKKLAIKLRRMEAQLENFAELEGRRSRMPVELVNLAGKVGIDIRELKAAGEKMTVPQVDAMFAAAKNQGIIIDPKDRMGMKNLLLEQGMMEDGAVDRGYGRIN